MNNLLNIFSPSIAYAAAAKNAAIKVFVSRVDDKIVNPLILLMFAAALMYFLFGVLQFLINQSNPGEAETGKQHMLWGVIGMFIMISVFGIIKLIEHTLGVGPNPIVG